MLRHVKAVAAVSLFALMACSPAFAENRLALVIGNSAYRSVTPLPNAQNDANKMSELLGSAGFEVMNKPDLSQDDLRKTIGEFAGKLAAKGPDTVALVFYAGHGIQVDGENFIVPVDVDPKREADIPLQAVRLNDLLNTLNSVPNKTRIVMLDACRNNPFPAISQSAGRGLAMVDTKSGAPGTFISYSTSPGAEAEDGSGANSPYTSAVLNVAREPGLSIEDAFKRVRISVNEVTQGRQVPWESSSLTSDFRFFVSGDAAQAAAAASVPKPRGPMRSVEDWKRDLQGKQPSVAYDLVLADNTVEAYGAFVELYAQTPFASRARTLLDRRKEMMMWYETVVINTPASYRAFVAAFPGSDLAATARKLEDRVRNRSLNANAALLPGAQAAVTPTPVNATPLPTNVASAPATCPCVVAPQPAKKKADTKPPVKRAETPPPRRIRPPTDADVGIAPPPPRANIPPALMEGIGVGIGIGIGSGLGGGGRRPPSGGYHPQGGSPGHYR
jgi:uncharacterized caspase-like protein